MEGWIQLHAEDTTRREISSLNLAEALRSFLRIPTPARHVSLLVNLMPTPQLDATFNVLRRLLTDALQRPVFVAYGPHSGEHFGYLFRRELPYGPAIVFTADSPCDRAIPGARYTFAQLHQALALSEYDTLAHWERPVIRLHLMHDLPAALDQLTQLFEHSLQHFRP